MTTTISPLPTPPSPADSPADFNAKAFALLGALPAFVSEANAQASGLDAAVASAGVKADAAALKAGEALTSANNAAISKTDADSARDAAVIAKNAAEAALDSFDDRYLGQKPADPANDNDGGALLVGALYFRTTAPIGMKVWTGTAWDDAYANLSSKFDKTGGDIDGNINITGTGRRITGDFSNATVANRLMFQTSTTNGATSLHVVPNGTSTQTQYSLHTDPALTNGPFGDVTLNSSLFRFRTGVSGTGTAVPMMFDVNGAERLRIDPTTGNVLAVSGALGYGVGAGGTVVQATSKSTAVTLNQPTGRITMNAATLGAGQRVSFVLYNSVLGAGDTMLLCLSGGTDSPDEYQIRARIAPAAAAISVHNQSGAALSDGIVINFVIIKGAAS